MNHTNETPINNHTEESEETLEQQDIAATEMDAEVVSEPINAEDSEFEKLNNVANENYQRFLRVQADFDNFRRRSRQEKEDFAKYASVKLIEQLLPVVDNFERALVAGKDSTDTEAILKGLEMIYNLMIQVLEQEGLKQINAVGEPFNPEFHHAIMQVESADHEEGIVIEEVQKGYIIKDKVLRPSMVKVSS